MPDQFVICVVYFVSDEFYGDHKTHKVEVNPASFNFWDVIRFKTVVPI